MTEFRVGDMVRVITHRFGEGHYGKVGIVRKVFSWASRGTDLSIQVQLLEGECNLTPITRSYGVVDLTHVTQSKDTAPRRSWMVALVKDGVFKPSPEPKQHPTQAEALEEAMRLASKHGGEFHVLKSVVAASRPAAPVTITVFK